MEGVSRSYATLEDWIKRETIPFSIDSANTFNAAVDQVVASLGDSVELLGFGEALHGSEEILILRNRLFQCLVEKRGYSAIAVESSFSRGRLVNEYVNGRGLDSYEAVKETGFSHNFGRLEANRELVEWMRDYNADDLHRVKLQFYGFDGPMEMMYSDSPRQVLQFVLDYLSVIDRERAQEYRERIEPLLGKDVEWEDPAIAFDPTKGIGRSSEATSLRIVTENLISELQIRRPELVAESDPDRYLEAMQYASVARQLLNYHAGLAGTEKKSERRLVELLGIRDAMMADILAYIVSREQRQRKKGKVLAFAHNSHLKLGKAEWQLGSNFLSWWPAGAHLHEMLGPRYAMIGTGLGVSDDNGIGQPEIGTLEARLTAVLGPVRFVPTHQGRGLPPSEIAALSTRTGSMKNQTYFPFTAQSFTDFDWLAVLDSTVYHRGGPPLP